MSPSTQKIHVTTDNKATIICPHCGKKRAIDATKYRQTLTSLKVRCTCGSAFRVAMEFKSTGQIMPYVSNTSAFAAIQRVFPNAENGAKIVCPDCEKTTLADITRYRDTHQAFKVRCSCGWTFYVLVDTRKCYRKPTTLFGGYYSAKSKKFEDVVVQNVSVKGLGFKTALAPAFSVGDTIDVEFTLDNPQKTAIQKRVLIRWIQENRVGGEFSDTYYQRELGYYAMP